MSTFLSVSPSFKTNAGSLFPLDSANSYLQDMKSYLSVILSYDFPTGTTVSDARVIIDDPLVPNNGVSNIITLQVVTGNIFTISYGATSSMLNSNITFPFEVNSNHKILFKITLNTNGVNVLYQWTYSFTYVNPTPTLSDFTFISNVGETDDIDVSGLTVVNPTSDSPVNVVFSFQELEVSIADENNQTDHEYHPVETFNSAGSYLLENNTLAFDKYYEVSATANWSAGYSTSVNSTQPLFMITRPSISGVSAYDVQNDSDNDGVGGVGGDSLDQVIATITLANVGYVKHIPLTVQFNFYDSTGKKLIATSSSYNYTTKPYDIQLNQVTPLNAMENGTEYKVTATATFPTITVNGVLYPQTRTSDPDSIIFKQGVAPVLAVTVGNTWALVSKGDPSSASSTLYDACPKLGISGYFLKNSQFMSGYSKNLDKTSTKFLLQYKIGNGSLSPVVSAALIQQGSEALEQTMINAMGSDSLTSSSTGQYQNVVPSGSSVNANLQGPDQNPLVFYIPIVQGNVTFQETDNVTVSVTIIDTTSQWVIPGSNTPSNVSSAVLADPSPLLMVNKIPTYSYNSSDKGELIEPSIADVYSGSYTMNGVWNNQTTKANVEINNLLLLGGSSNIIIQTTTGWNVVNAVTGLKVNLYYYRNPLYEPPISLTAPWTSTNKQQNSMNSFTMSQINQTTGLGMWCVINQSPSAILYPFIAIQTCPTDPVDTPLSPNYGYWFKSNIVYIAPANIVSIPGLTLLYTGTDDGSLYSSEIPAARRIKLSIDPKNSNRQSLDFSNELVSMISVHTDSSAAAGKFNFNLRNTGVDTTYFLGKYQLDFTPSSLRATGDNMKALYDNQLIQVNKIGVFADSDQKMVTQTPSGWAVVNPAPVGTGTPIVLSVPKVNLYYYMQNNGATKSFNMGQINQSSALGMWYVIDQQAGATQYPFLIAYTDPTQVTLNPKASWYKSKIFYGPYSSETNLLPNPSLSGLTLLYTGTDDGSLYPAIPLTRRVKLAVNAGLSDPVTQNSDLSSENVMMISIQTSSNASETNAGDFNFVLKYAGVYFNSLLGQYQIPFTECSLVMVNNMMSLVDDSIIVADSARIITKSNKGWTVVNPPAQPGLPSPKVNLYYLDRVYGGAPFTNMSIAMNQVDNSNLGVWFIINQNTTAWDYPFINIYTDPKMPPLVAPAINNASWYRSRINYSAGNLSTAPLPPNKIGFTLMYTGTDNGTLYPEIPASRRIKLVLDKPPYTIANSNYSNELINQVAIGTSSGMQAGRYNFNLLYAGITTTVAGFSNINAFFVNPLLKLNIPLEYGFSDYFNDATVDFLNTPNTNTVVKNVASTWSDQSVSGQTINDDLCVGISTLPVLTQSQYNVQYSIMDPNSNAVIKGPVSSTSTVSTLNEPQINRFPPLSDFSVYNFNFNTINNNQKSSIVFDLVFNPYTLDRIDGVHVYFAYGAGYNVSVIPIGNFKKSQSGTGIEIVLLQPNSNTLTFGNNLLTWNPYTSATVTFVPYRDNRVDSDSDEMENLLATWTAPIVWNIPVINKPSAAGPESITLSGGVITSSSSSNNLLNWAVDTSSEFTYYLTISQDSKTPTIVPYTVNAGTAQAVLPVASSTTNAYTVTLQKVFMGQYSAADTITFNSVNVDTSQMVIKVFPPSSNTIIYVSWDSLVVSGTGSSYANNVASLCLTDNGNRINTSSNAPDIEISVPTGSSYVITNPIGYILQLCMKLTARVQYSVNGGASSNSSAVSVPLSLPITRYTVSTIPSVSLTSANSSTVLLQGGNTSSLLLNLDANGLESEGFISLVLVLTQDGTPIKPAGCEVLLQFPQNPSSANPFSFANVLSSSSVVDINLVGGEPNPSTATPLNLVPTGLSTNGGVYTLKVGPVNTDGPRIGRYSLSSLTFPASNLSGFVNGQETNIMAILTSRRGTDVMVGSFTYYDPVFASNVGIVFEDGKYFVQFFLGTTPAPPTTD
jgi:hypothetical protein